MEKYLEWECARVNLAYDPKTIAARQLVKDAIHQESKAEVIQLFQTKYKMSPAEAELRYTENENPDTDRGRNAVARSEFLIDLKSHFILRSRDFAANGNMLYEQAIIEFDENPSIDKAFFDVPAGAELLFDEAPHNPSSPGSLGNLK